MKGEVQQKQAAAVPTTYTHQDESDTYRLANQNAIQNQQQLNFLDMDPIIYRALHKSREVMSKCNPYQTTDPYVPILLSSNTSYLPQTGMQSIIQPTQNVSLGNSQLNQYFHTSQQNSQFQQFNQINQVQIPTQPLQQSQFQKQSTFSQPFYPYNQQNEQTSLLKQPAMSQFIQYQQTFIPPSFNQQQSIQNLNQIRYEPYVRNDRFS